MATKVKIGGTWVDRTLSYIKQGGTWVLGSSMYYKSGGTWVSQDGSAFPPQIITPERWYNFSASDPIDVTSLSPARNADSEGYYENHEASFTSVGTASFTPLGYDDGKFKFRLASAANGTQTYKSGIAAFQMGSSNAYPILDGAWRLFYSFVVSDFSLAGIGSALFYVQDYNATIVEQLITGNGTYTSSVNITTTGHLTETNFVVASVGSNSVANMTIEVDYLYIEPQ